MIPRPAPTDSRVGSADVSRGIPGRHRAAVPAAVEDGETGPPRPNPAAATRRSADAVGVPRRPDRNRPPRRERRCRSARLPPARRTRGFTATDIGPFSPAFRRKTPYPRRTGPIDCDPSGGTRGAIRGRTGAGSPLLAPVERSSTAVDSGSGSDPEGGVHVPSYRKWKPSELFYRIDSNHGA